MELCGNLFYSTSNKTPKFSKETLAIRVRYVNKVRNVLSGKTTAELTLDRLAIINSTYPYTAQNEENNIIFMQAAEDQQ